ncbi:23S rRNA (cytidine1920-2'-O)/16S rRNA (cytidine1409-2'-O)-methyltransferase [Desulfallas thermosapovorans DSM 6562]|uniref:23S rRNA (Cytidine1920-2'-O)/16S rRNA (Cytidine1409-2'-O)-methyltransferase n=1 Tax=Desulfallas thermosapovorans DSM 6562 TaxID=1121431 RepID=A0A5S4ZRS8_9FIRM|nr:23S rRNA (cytidine1920-2'-O)/16S rRNA (cytidine1409-2'-O)-methyltransferase [Desulfallas thermosapovorans DSM 6562]
MAEKKRIDVLLVEKGFFDSREKARAALMAGEVMVNGQLADKPGQRVDAHQTNIIVKPKMPYVSRGGYKLARALQVFPIDMPGKVVLDIGASTGGFTDCALQNGAAAVYAVDVGYGQMAWSLRSDPRVTVLERTNIRYMERDVFIKGMPDLVTIDVSFISLTLVLPRLDYLLDKYEGVALVKPQFEAGRGVVGKKGVVKDPGVHREVLQKVVQSAGGLGIAVLGIDYSPIKGPEGNIEYLLHFKKPASAPGGLNELIVRAVSEAHRNLSGGSEH